MICARTNTHYVHHFIGPFGCGCVRLKYLCFSCFFGQNIIQNLFFSLLYFTLQKKRKKQAYETYKQIKQNNSSETSENRMLGNQAAVDPQLKLMRSAEGE